MAALAAAPALGLSPRVELAVRLLLPLAAILLVSLPVLSFRPRYALASAALGAAVFAIWIAPDLLIPGWREHWIFQNALTGKLESSLPLESHSDPLILFMRIARAVIVVPLAEELFWRGWMMRWLIHHDFQSVPLGAYRRDSFWITALLFAAVHGPYWEVGLITGAVYNGWMVRTKSLADLVLAHAVTNGCLAAFVLATKRWEYWL